MVHIITTNKSKVGDLDSSLGEKSESVRAEGFRDVGGGRGSQSTCTSKLCHALAEQHSGKVLLPVCVDRAWKHSDLSLSFWYNEAP